MEFKTIVCFECNIKLYSKIKWNSRHMFVFGCIIKIVICQTLPCCHMFSHNGGNLTVHCMIGEDFRIIDKEKIRPGGWEP